MLALLENARGLIEVCSLALFERGSVVEAAFVMFVERRVESALNTVLSCVSSTKTKNAHVIFSISMFASPFFTFSFRGIKVE